MATQTNGEPRHHTQKMQNRLQETIDHLRSDIGKIDEPQLKSMFETSAEVLTGLNEARGGYRARVGRRSDRHRADIFARHDLARHIAVRRNAADIRGGRDRLRPPGILRPP